MQSKSGYTIEQLAQTASSLYGKCVFATQEDPMFWTELADRAVRVLEWKMGNGETLDVIPFAKDLFSVMMDDKSAIDQWWDGQDEVGRLACEAVARHMVNCMVIRQEPIDFDEAEAYWSAWINERLDHEGVSV